MLMGDSTATAVCRVSSILVLQVCTMTSTISEDGRPPVVIKFRIALAKVACIKNKRMPFRNISIETRKSFIKSFERHVVMYGSETWNGENREGTNKGF